MTESTLADAQPDEDHRHQLVDERDGVGFPRPRQGRDNGETGDGDENCHREVLHHQNAPYPLAASQRGANSLGLEAQRIGAHDAADHNGEQIQGQAAEVVALHTGEVIGGDEGQANGHGDDYPQ